MTMIQNNIVRPHMGFVRAISPEVDDTRTITFVASNGERDRHGTVMNMRNWNLEPFNNNGVIGYQHDVYGDGFCVKADPDDVIGSGVARVEGDELLVDVTFEPEDINPKAEKIFKKVRHGSLRACSVGIVTIGEGHFGEGEERQGGSRQTYYFGGQELYELSIVNIPSNRSALKRNHGDFIQNALRYITGQLGADVRDVEKMTVGDVLHALNMPTAMPEMPANKKLRDISTEVERLRKEYIR